MVFNETSPRLIAFSGTNAAGKDTASMVLADKGFYVVSVGDILRAEAEKQYLPKDRDTLIEIAAGLRKRTGNLGELALRAIDSWAEVRDEYDKGLCINGIRALAEAETVQQSGGVVCYLDAPAERRYVRAIIRSRDGEGGISYKDFSAQELKEYEGSSYNLRSNLKAIKSIADIVLVNEGSKEDFLKNIHDQLLSNHN